VGLEIFLLTYVLTKGLLTRRLTNCVWEFH